MLLMLFYQKAEKMRTETAGRFTRRRDFLRKKIRDKRGKRKRKEKERRKREESVTMKETCVLLCVVVNVVI